MTRKDEKKDDKKTEAKPMGFHGLKFEIQEEVAPRTRIRVIGVGGGGSNAVARMLQVLARFLLESRSERQVSDGPSAQSRQAPRSDADPIPWPLAQDCANGEGQGR